MERNRRISFDFDDSGSLRRLQKNYDEFVRQLMARSIDMRNNLNGRPGSEMRHLQDEIKYYQKLYEEQQKVFRQKKEEHDKLLARKRQYEQLFNSGRITAGTYEGALAEYNDGTRDLLRGTGRRTWNTYERSMQAGGANMNRLERLMENTNAILRNILGQEREDALRTIEAIENNENASMEERIAADQARERMNAANNNNPTADKRSILGDLFRFQNLNSFLNAGVGTLTANSSLEGVKKLSQAAKEGVVAGVDILADLAGTWIGKETGEAAKKGLRKGAVLGLKAGARIGGAFWDVASDQMFAAFEERQNYDRVNFGNRALTGSNLGLNTMSQYGYSALDFSNANTGIARAMGTGRGSEDQTKNALLLERGFGINQQISAALLELTRTNKDTDKNLINIVGGIYSSGKNIFNGDRTFLGEFITKNFTTLQRDLLKNQASVRSGTVMDILNRFNSVGGQFSARHDNSLGLISSINNAISSPGSASMDALTYNALRKAMPGATLDDILVEREKGTSSKFFLNGVMSELDSFGGTDAAKMMQISGAFGISNTAARELARAYKKNPRLFDNIQQGGLQGVIDGLPGMAAENTTMVDRHAAELSDAKIAGDWQKMFTLIDQMKEVILECFNGAHYTIMPDGKMVMKLGSVETKTPPSQAKKELEASNARSTMRFGF